MKNFLIFSVLFYSTLFSQQKKYFQQEVNYEIDVTLDDNNHTLSAYEKISYKNNSPDELSFIWFHIWPNAYKDDSTAYAKQAGPSSRFAKSDSTARGYIDSLEFTVNGRKASWSYHPEWIDVIKLELNTPLKSGQTIAIETPFFVKLPGEVFSRLGHTGKHYEITQWYPKPAVYDRKGWHPMPYLNQGEFYSEYGSFDVKITLPEDYRIMATGDLINGEAEYQWLSSLTSITDSLNRLSEKELKKWAKSQNDSKNTSNTDSVNIDYKTVHFRQKNVHDFAWFADQKWLVQKGELTLSSSSSPITLWSFYLPKNAELWSNSIEYLHDSGYWFSKYYGDYPYNHITAVDGDLSAGGGMEYPNITVIASMPSKHLLEMVIMHEVGHNWFYGIVGSNERYHTWMDEGLNDYSNIRYWQDKYKDANERFVVFAPIQDKLGIGKNLKYSWTSYLGYSTSAKSPSVQPLNLKADEYTSGNYGLNYSKTGVFTRFLHHYLGEDKMDEVMQKYYQKWKYKHPYPEDFRAVFEKNTNKDLDWYFNGVFETTDYIDYSIRKKGGKYTVTNHGTLNAPVEVVFYGKDKNEINRTWLEGIDKEKDIQGPNGARYAIIDPDEHMPDVKRENNATKGAIRFHWVWDQPTYYDHDINFAPWTSYNYYNGWTPGVMFYKGGTPGYSGLTAAEAFWDGNNSKPVGKATKTFNYESNNLFDRSSLAFSGMDLQGNRGGKIKYNGSLKKNDATSNFSMELNHNILDETALDSSLYSAGAFTVSAFQYDYNKNFKGIFDEIALSSGILFGEKFSKGWLSGRTQINFNKKNNMRVRGWVGDYFNKEDVPKHFRSYLSGGIDPTFSSYVFDRTGISDLSVMQLQYIRSGPALRGYATENEISLSSSNMTWGLNIDSKIAFLPTFFYDIAGGDDFENTYSAAGIVLGPIILPLYQSWEKDDQTATDAKWITDRLRLQFSLSLDFSRGIRISL